MNEERIKELFAKEEFVTELMEKETPEEAQELFLKYDIDVSATELEQAYKILSEHAGEELTEEDLENIAGGCAVLGAVVMFLVIGLSAGAAGSTAGVLINRRVRW